MVITNAIAKNNLSEYSNKNKIHPFYSGIIMIRYK